MPAQERYYSVATNANDGRKYTTLPPISNGNGNGKKYRRVWLRTKDARTAALRIGLLTSVGEDLFKDALAEVCDFPSKMRGKQPLLMVPNAARPCKMTFTESWEKLGVWSADDERKLIEYILAGQRYRPGDRNNIINKHPEGFVLRLDEHGRAITDSVPQSITNLEAVGDMEALQEYARQLQQYLPENERKQSRASKYKLADCRDEWKEWANLDGKGVKHIDAYVGVFDELITVIGDKACNHLEKPDFSQWHKHIKAERKAGERGPKWEIDHLRPISAILLHTSRVTDYPLPDGIKAWVDFKMPKYGKTPKKINRQPVSVDDFAKLFDKADEWAAINVHEYAKALPATRGHLSESNNIKQAYRIKRQGYLWRACLRLMAQCSLDPIDIQRLTFDFITLDGKLPLFCLARYKPIHEVGEPIERLTPLLKSTVNAIKDWREYYENDECPRVKRSVSQTVVFPSEHGSAWCSAPVSRSFSRLRDACNLTGFSLKHLRNIAPTVRRNAGLPNDMSKAIQGHTVEGQTAFYTGDHPDNYLLPLVDVVGKEYDFSRK